MNMDIKKIDATRREMKFEVPPEQVKKKLDDVYKDIAKEARIKGFRPGKAPRHVLEQKYNQVAQEEMVKQIIPEAYQKALTQEDLSPIDLPDIDDVAYKDGTVRFTARFDVRPDVKIKNYKGIKVKRKKAGVPDEELDKTLDYIKKGQGKSKEIAIDDNFAKGLGYPSLEEFKNSLRKQLEIDKDRQAKMDVENQIVEHLLKNANLAVPKSAVQKQMERRIEEQKKHLRSHGLKDEDIEKRLHEGRKDMQKTAERDLQLYFILEKIAQEENIQLDDKGNFYHKVLEFLLKEANWEEAK